MVHSISLIHHYCGLGVIVDAILIACRGSSCTTGNAKTGVMSHPACFVLSFVKHEHIFR